MLTEFRRADWLLLFALSVPSYALAVYLRALRWRHLTNAIKPLPVGGLFRAVAVGFMANNLFPLRVGEFVRAWQVGRENGIAPASVFGTVVIERLIDALCVVLLALGVVVMFGGETGAWRQGVLWLSPMVVLPLVGLGILRAYPSATLCTVGWLLRPLPSSLAGWATRQLESFAGGLGSLQGGVHLFWVALHSAVIWLAASTLPVLAAFWALDIDFGSPQRTLAAGWMTLAAVGIAVALPSAPGFFGVYHSACRLVLERFGIPPETALALGTVLHAVFWLTLTAMGAAVLRGRPASLGEIGRLTRR